MDSFPLTLTPPVTLPSLLFLGPEFLFWVGAGQGQLGPVVLFFRRAPCLIQRVDRSLSELNYADMENTHQVVVADAAGAALQFGGWPKFPLPAHARHRCNNAKNTVHSERPKLLSPSVTEAG